MTAGIITETELKQTHWRLPLGFIIFCYRLSEPLVNPPGYSYRTADKMESRHFRMSCRRHSRAVQHRSHCYNGQIRL